MCVHLTIQANNDHKIKLLRGHLYDYFICSLLFIFVHLFNLCTCTHTHSYTWTHTYLNRSHTQAEHVAAIRLTVTWLTHGPIWSMREICQFYEIKRNNTHYLSPMVSSRYKISIHCHRQRTTMLSKGSQSMHLNVQYQRNKHKVHKNKNKNEN